MNYSNMNDRFGYQTGENMKYMGIRWTPCEFLEKRSRQERNNIDYLIATKDLIKPNVDSALLAL